MSREKAGWYPQKSVADLSLNIYSIQLEIIDSKISNFKMECNGNIKIIIQKKIKDEGL